MDSCPKLDFKLNYLKNISYSDLYTVQAQKASNEASNRWNDFSEPYKLLRLQRSKAHCDKVHYLRLKMVPEAHNWAWFLPGNPSGSGSSQMTF